MSQYRNHTVYNNPTPEERKILQWNRFNQREYLETEHGITDYDTIAEYIEDVGAAAWSDVIKPGTAPGQLDAYMFQKLISVLISADSGKYNMSGYPLSRFKPGLDVLEKNNIIPFVLSNSEIRGANLSCSFLPYSSISFSKIKKAHVHRSLIDGSNISFSLIERSVLAAISANGLNINDSSIQRCELTNVSLALGGQMNRFTLNKCEGNGFKIDGAGAVINNIQITNNDLQRLELINTSYLVDSSIKNNNSYQPIIKIEDGESSAFEKNEFIFGSLIIDNCDGFKFIDNKFIQTSVGGVHPTSLFLRNDFTQASFVAGFDIAGSTLISCNFTGSTLTDIYPTKTDFTNAINGNSFGNTWVDGTAVD